MYPSCFMPAWGSCNMCEFKVSSNLRLGITMTSKISHQQELGNGYIPVSNCIRRQEGQNLNERHRPSTRWLDIDIGLRFQNRFFEGNRPSTHISHLLNPHGILTLCKSQIKTTRICLVCLVFYCTQQLQQNRKTSSQAYTGSQEPSSHPLTGTSQRLWGSYGDPQGPGAAGASSTQPLSHNERPREKNEDGTL